MTIRALVTPEVMKWARETAKLSIDEAAARIKRSPEEIALWENGELKPSMAQAREAARVYKRPLAVFYLPSPPVGWQVLRDFRTLPADESRDYDSELSYVIRETASRQEWMSEFLLGERNDPVEFLGSATLAQQPQDIAAKIRSYLGIETEAITRCRTREEALNLWMKKTEEIGIFISRSGDVECIQARGFVLTDKYAPFIFLNSSDAKVAQIFTLAHELAHLWINEPGVSNLEERGRYVDSSTQHIEMFCNQIAGFVILVQSEFEEKLREMERERDVKNVIEQLSSYFRVSREVVARRLRDMRRINRETYQALRQQYHNEWINFREQERLRRQGADGGPSYYRVLLSKNGKAYSQTVLGAYYSGTISGRETSSLLNIKLNKLSKLADEAGVFQGVYRGE